MPIRITRKTVNPELAHKIREISGQNVHACIQCGTCGGVCPMYGEVSTAPRTIVQMAQLGLELELAETNTADFCASCHHCVVRCPRDLDMPKMMEALRQLHLRTNVDKLRPEDIPTEEMDDLPQIALVAAFRKLTG